MLLKVPLKIISNAISKSLRLSEIPSEKGFEVKPDDKLLFKAIM